ncbi:MAG: M48 family metallopeptidase [Gammaproteobacteria bacterium]|nr:MAG: M48 family metallopeptidase [Gammaproteobacteria bacterium]
MDLFAQPVGECGLSIRKSKRARRLSVRVFPHGHAEVVVPLRTPPREVEAFVDSSRDWIQRTRSQLLRHEASSDLSLPATIRLGMSEELWQVNYGPGRARLVQEPADQGGRLQVAGSEDSARTALRRWLADRARACLVPWTMSRGAQLGLVPSAVSIRRQQTRWGSCSSKRGVSLNCALLFLERELVDYLIVHELCHLKHMNHSRRFWSLLGSILPDYKDREEAISGAWQAVPGWVFYPV